MQTLLKTLVSLLLITSLIFDFTSCRSGHSSFNEKQYADSINQLREKNYHEIIDSTVSRFNETEIQQFKLKKPAYFKPDPGYIVDATFILDTSSPVFEMPTTTDRKPLYRIYGYLSFIVNDTNQKLTVYQNYDYKDHPEYGNYLFVPFMDKTNGFSTYGGGRYLDIPIPENTSLQIDFNTAFNPYCAYAERWSCPLVPNVNDLDVSIIAGEKKYK